MAMAKRTDTASGIKIEQGIPAPVCRRKIKWPFKSMKVGDSFVARAANRQSFYVSASGQGMKCTAQKMPDGTYRVWRTA
jgi:hypothetical protein